MLFCRLPCNFKFLFVVSVVNHEWALLNSKTAKRRNGELAKQEYFYTPIFFSETLKKKFTRIFFHLAKQDICTSGFWIQLSIYINIESLSDTEKEVRHRVRQIRSSSEFCFLKCSTRIFPLSQNAFFLLALTLTIWQSTQTIPKFKKHSMESVLVQQARSLGVVWKWRALKNHPSPLPAERILRDDFEFFRIQLNGKKAKKKESKEKKTQRAEMKKKTRKEKKKRKGKEKSWLLRVEFEPTTH